MTKVLSEATTLNVAPESSFGTQPTSEWEQWQPNPGGIQDYAPDLMNVARDPLSVYATKEKGEVVGLNATPKIVMDWTYDRIHDLGGLMFRSVPKHAGNKAQSLYRPTAVTSTGYTVAALGDLTAGLLIHAKGFPTAANNGLKVVGSSSTGTETKTSGLVAESLDATRGGTFEVAGVQGAADDITLNSSGNLTSTVLDFTTLGLNVGQTIKIGDGGTGTSFATTAYNGRARIVSIAAGLIVLEHRTWTPSSADLGAGKTIRLLFTKWYRNVALDHADYREPTLHGELVMLGAGTGGAATYTYAPGMALKTIELDAPLESKITCTATFCAKDVQDPVLVASRAAGASSARRPQAANLFQTAAGLRQKPRLVLTSSGNDLSSEVNSWKFKIEHNVEPREIQGELGAHDMDYGKIEPSLSMEIYFNTMELPIALRADSPSDPIWFDVCPRNGNGAFHLDMPFVGINGGKPTFAANKAVMVSLDVPGFRDPASNRVASMSVFAYHP